MKLRAFSHSQTVTALTLLLSDPSPIFSRGKWEEGYTGFRGEASSSASVIYSLMFSQ